ncbi:MAG: DUF1667 domain-containing protein [Ruminococcaceae bacterium]|nr:DUF1667 domain-containing protein [Oscillospiraceae bacterium]
METRELTCVVCPAGCRVTVTLDDAGNVTDVTGHTCARGKTYAESEVTHPVRTLTTTVSIADAVSGAHMLPVKTNKPISRELLFDAMRQLEGYVVKAPVKSGDVLIRDFMEPGVELVACKTIA